MTDTTRRLKDVINGDGWIYEYGTRRRPSHDGALRLKDFDLKYRSPDWLSENASRKTLRGVPELAAFSRAKEYNLGDFASDSSSQSMHLKNMRISEVGIDLILKYEGFSAEKGGKLYNDMANHCTIGYGHLVHYGPCSGEASEGPFKNGMTKAEAKQLFMKNIFRYEDIVKKSEIIVNLTQNQFDALCSFAYNMGNIPSLLAGYINNKNLDLAYKQILKYKKYFDKKKKQYVVSSGLLRRRMEEAKLFMGGLK